MNPTLEFFFYLGALVCFVLAAVGEGWGGRVSGRGRASRIALLPLGLALWIFPLVWNTGKAVL